MVEADQHHRDYVLGHAQPAGGLTPDQWQWHVDESYRLNEVHASRLREIVAILGDWPTIELVGTYASDCACLLAVHHHEDVDFLEWARDRMEPHVETRNVPTDCYAQVFDRAQLARTGLQRYGTQFRSEVTDDVTYFGVAPVEEPETLLERRTEIGLRDFGEYAASQRANYRVPEDVAPYPDEPVIPGLGVR